MCEISRSVCAVSKYPTDNNDVNSRPGSINQTLVTSIFYVNMKEHCLAQC